MRRYGGLVAIAVAALLTIGAGGLSRAHPAVARASPATAQGPYVTWVPVGAATREFTLVRPAGAIRQLSVAVPHGTDMSLTASIPHVAGVAIWTPRSGVSETCRERPGVELCVQSVEACPMPRATWRLSLSKVSGPAGAIRIRFVVGPQP